MTIEQLAMVTRLNTRFIEALESGRRDLLPGQVYLKPFVKTCAEALDLSVKELYKLIEGEAGDDGTADLRIEFQDEKKKGSFYKVPVVLLIAAAVIAIIYFSIKTREKIPPKTEITEVIPANATKVRDDINWSRPWEKPAFYLPGRPQQNLALAASADVGVSVISADDTLFEGILEAGQKQVFYSENGFLLNLSSNAGITGFVNGRRDSIIGSGGNLKNYLIEKQEDR